MRSLPITFVASSFQVIEISEYRTQLYEYLQNRMMAIAPNVTVMVGELVGARLIAHAGDSVNVTCNMSVTQYRLGTMVQWWFLLLCLSSCWIMRASSVTTSSETLWSLVRRLKLVCYHFSHKSSQFSTSQRKIITPRFEYILKITVLTGYIAILHHRSLLSWNNSFSDIRQILQVPFAVKSWYMDCFRYLYSGSVGR